MQGQPAIVHRLTPPNESGAQKDGVRRFDKSLQGLSARASREGSATGGERPAPILQCQASTSGTSRGMPERGAAQGVWPSAYTETIAPVEDGVPNHAAWLQFLLTTTERNNYHGKDAQDKTGDGATQNRQGRIQPR